MSSPSSQPQRGPRPHIPWLLAGSLGLVFLATIVAVLWFVRRETPSPAPSSGEPITTQGDWPIYISTMTHLEGNWLEAATNRDYFNRQANLVRHGMDIAEEYDAVLTIESEIPMAEGMVSFGDNLLQEVLDRGHGVGTHCDVKPLERYSQAEIVEQFTERKVLVDDLVGADENYGCSGGGGYSDWYAGATGAGFHYINGVVGYHYLALPQRLRPAGWDDKAIAREYYHLPAPQSWDQYFYPFLVSKLGFEEDADGDLLVSDGALGRVDALAEAGEWTLMSDTDCPRGGCAFTADDVQAAVDFITAFAAEHDGSRPAKITFYFATDVFKDINDEALQEFFAAMQSLVDDGVVQWASQREVYDGVMEYYGKRGE